MMIKKSLVSPSCVSQIDEVFRKKTAVTHDTQNRIINNSGHLISIKIMSIINYDKNVTCEEAGRIISKRGWVEHRQYR